MRTPGIILRVEPSSQSLSHRTKFPRRRALIPERSHQNCHTTENPTTLFFCSASSSYAEMIARRLPRAAGLLKQVSRPQQTCPAIIGLSKRSFTTPTKPLNATEVTIERDALLSPSARKLDFGSILTL
jgi:hypothetical protein